MELVVDRVEAVDRHARDARSLDEREVGIGDDRVHVRDVAREQVGLRRVAVTGQDMERIEILEPHERGSCLGEPRRLIDVREGMLGGVARKHEPQLGNPDREVVFRVARRVDQQQRQVAAVDDRGLRRRSDVGAVRHEVVEAPRLALASARERRFTLVAAQPRGAALVADEGAGCEAPPARLKTWLPQAWS